MCHRKKKAGLSILTARLFIGIAYFIPSTIPKIYGMSQKVHTKMLNLLKFCLALGLPFQ